MTIAGESDRETNEATRQFSFYPATTGLSTDCDILILSCQCSHIFGEFGRPALSIIIVVIYKKKNTKVNNEYLYTIPWFIHNCIHRSF